MSDGTGRILLVTRNLPPVIGGMERLIGHVGDVLSANFESFVVGPRGATLRVAPAGFLGAPLSPLPIFLAASFAQALRAGVGFRPQLCLAGSALMAPAAAAAARVSGARLGVYVHGLDLVTPHRLYRRFFLPPVARADLVLANSRNTRRLAIAIGAAAEKIEILHPGVAVPASPPDREAARHEFRRRFGLSAGPVLLAAGRLTARKGLAEFVRRCLPPVASKLADVQLVIAGAAPEHAVGRSEDALAAIRAAAADTGTASRVHLVGPLSDEILGLAYAAADLHVFPVRDTPGDVEGFGMVALEAAASGLPTVAFDVGGVADAVAQGASGILVPPNDYQAMAGEIIRYLGAGWTGIDSQSCRQFAQGLAWDRFDRRLRGLCAEQIAADSESGLGP